MLGAHRCSGSSKKRMSPPIVRVEHLSVSRKRVVKSASRRSRSIYAFDLESESEKILLLWLRFFRESFEIWCSDQGSEGTCSGWRRFRATNVDGRLRARVVKGAGVLYFLKHDTTRTRRHPRPFRPYSQEHARVLRVRAHPRAGAGATRTRLLPCSP